MKKQIMDKSWLNLQILFISIVLTKYLYNTIEKKLSRLIHLICITN